MHRRLALVRRPSPRLPEGLTTHIQSSPIDLDLAVRQWEGYVQALNDAGWQTVEVPPADDCPDSVFIEDTVVVYGDRAVVTRPGADERKPEIEALPEVLRAQGYHVEHIEGPGTLDGGDVLKHDGTVYVGLGARTNGEGVRQLAAHLAPLGARVQAVPCTRALHLKSAVTALPDGTVIGWTPVVDDAAAFPVYRGMPEEPGAHVVLLGGNHLLMATSAPASIAELEREGYQVTAVDISEFEKLEGCVTCLSVRLRG